MYFELLLIIANQYCPNAVIESNLISDPGALCYTRERRHRRRRCLTQLRCSIRSAGAGVGVRRVHDSRKELVANTEEKK